MGIPLLSSDSNADRREQILGAAMICFAKRGFHQASMHDISAEAGISVGLIYRYFENKDDVISAMAERHKKQIHDLLEQASQAPTLLESLEILFTAHCCEKPQIQSAFVVDLYAEASRNPRLVPLMRDILETAMQGVTDLIARAPETLNAPHGLTPREIVELIFAVSRGMLMRDILETERDPEKRRERQLMVVRRLWRLLFQPEGEPTYA